VYLIVYRGFGYRKKVVLENLKKSFPEKSEEEINLICKRFYHYLCDFMVETFKILTISKKGIVKHCRFHPDSLALFNRLAEEKKSAIMVMGHVGNWEWAGHPFTLLCKQQLYVLYHPVKNKYFDKLMLDMRSRFGTKMLTMRSAYKEMVAHRNELTVTVFIADQTPQPDGAYWTTFLNQDTPVFKGTETIAKKLNMPVVYSYIRRVKRGYYEMASEMLVEDPAAMADGEISELHTRRLEQDIKANPEIWLWTHRRWKHKRE